MHNHHEHCQHEKVRYCTPCNLIHCLNCKKEWKDCTQHNYWNGWGTGSNIYYTSGINTLAQSQLGTISTANHEQC